MRISTRRLKRRRLKLIKARKEGATFSELQRRFGVSPNYLSKLFKGKDINKHCEHCGENDPKVLEKHHPDKKISQTTGFGYTRTVIAKSAGNKRKNKQNKKPKNNKSFLSDSLFHKKQLPKLK